jgi:hypothetical protein
VLIAIPGRQSRAGAGNDLLFIRQSARITGGVSDEWRMSRKPSDRRRAGCPRLEKAIMQKSMGLVLVLGFIAGIAIGQTRPEVNPIEISQGGHPYDRDEVVRLATLPVPRNEFAYLTASIPGETAKTLHNPRAAEGAIFYITDIFSESTVGLRMPPELNTGQEFQILQLGPEEIGLGRVKRPISLHTPLPFMTQITVRNQTLGYKDLVFAGYYAKQKPKIKSMDSIKPDK